MSLPELLSPAGSFDAAVAAFQYGADAVYTGLDRFSARAEAQNLTPERLAVLLAYARSLTPVRKIYCTVNTLLLDTDLAGAIETLDILDDLGVDGVIIQDWGLYALARRFFPRLPLHASTQMATHSRAGVQALAQQGFTRVVLARELTLNEITAAVRDQATEIEVFIHGALCYSVSGLCLFSSHALGRSGNRGRCAYCCRAKLQPATPSDAPTGHPFSMRDLSLLPYIKQLAEIGVASLKIEGRMKSPLYVAAITDLYRRALDGTLTAAYEAQKVADIQTIFSRPWTSLYATGTQAEAHTVIDPTAVGHRGTRIGTVQTVLRDNRGHRWLRFHTTRALEKHDGIQIEPAQGGQPQGFAVNALRRFPNHRLEFAVPSASDVEIELPLDFETIPAPGAPVYCSASQAVRRAYPIETVRASSLTPLRTCRVTVTLSANGIFLTADAQGEAADTATIQIEAQLTPARNPDQTQAAVQRAFERTNDAGWHVTHVDIRDPETLYAPPSLLNEGRRRLLDALTSARAARRLAARQEALTDITATTARPAGTSAQMGSARPFFTAKIHLTQIPVAALADADELIIQIGHADIDEIKRGLDTWQKIIPRDRIRLATPLLVSDAEAQPLETRLHELTTAGWQRWECADLTGLTRLQQILSQTRMTDITADWSFYALNRKADTFLREQGIVRRVTSPEETQENLTAYATAGATEALIFQLTPLFIAQTAPCTSGTKTTLGAIDYTAQNDRMYHTFQLDGRWITTAAAPFACAEAIPALLQRGIDYFRCDYSWYPLDAATVTSIWQAVHQYKAPAGSHAANFYRGLL